MLVLTRHIGQQLTIAGNIDVVVLEIRGNKVRLGVTAPREIDVQRVRSSSRPLPALPNPMAANSFATSKER